MNLLTKLLSAQISHCFLSSSQPRKRIFLFQAIAALQQASFSSSRTAKTKIAKPEEPSAPTASYVLNPLKLTRESSSASSWRRPSEIPFQGKAANSVKVIGLVRCPVQFQTFPDGKCVAATVIVQDKSELDIALDCSTSYVPSFFIPVVFEGDLAHVVRCHVKESDCVHVSGQLSGDHLPFEIGEYDGSFHIVAQDVYFVQGVERKVVSKKTVEINSDLENVNAASEDFYVKKTKNGEESIASDDSLIGVENGDQSATGNEDWWDVIKNPNDWWDYRGRKSEGKVKAKHPDFKHKEKGVGLWLNKAPNSVLKGLEGVEFSSKQVKSLKEEHWKSLVENPNKWWDNRLNKRNEKAPDFKHKESGQVLWLNGAPDWAIPNLPPLQDAAKVASAATWQGSLKFVSKEVCEKAAKLIGISQRNCFT